MFLLNDPASVATQFLEIPEFVGIYIGGVNAAPSTQRLLANSTGVTVNGTFNNSSDRNLKQNFAPVSSAKILEEVTQLPVSEWSYKEDPDTRHVGPVAQDFYSVFHIGTDDKPISPMDEGGVALAAIEGLNEKVESGKQKAESQMEELKAENAKLQAQMAHLQRQLDALQTAVARLASPSLHSLAENSQSAAK